MLAWPNGATDWACMLEDVQECYRRIVEAIVDGSDQAVIIISPCVDEAAQRLRHIDKSRIIYLSIPINDTWTRDYGAISVETGDGGYLVRDFGFNAWGGKFEACLDNLVTRRMAQAGVFGFPVTDIGEMVLEGGSIESDGRGCIMATERCLLNPNRNPSLTRGDIEARLRSALGAEKVLWLRHGRIAGDDTDGHIDTLARFAPGNTILHVSCDNPADEQFGELRQMETDLREFTDTQGKQFKLVPLPMPRAIHSSDGSRLPATYANFLVTNGSVLVPTYGQPDCDAEAVRIICEAFPGRQVVGVDCRALIEQRGSLHCSTMQFPEGVIKIE